MSNEIVPAEILDWVALSPDQRLVIRIDPRTTQASAWALREHMDAAGISGVIMVAAEEIRVINKGEEVER
jgi:hypothetical protein